MSQTHTMDRSFARTATPRETSPRPVTARVPRRPDPQARPEYGRPLPVLLLTLAQRTGRHPWVMPLLGLGLGILAAFVQRTATWLPVVVMGAGIALCIAVVAVAWVVRRRVWSGAALRPQEAVIDTDQAIPAAALAPVALLVGWVAGTLVL